MNMEAAGAGIHLLATAGCGLMAGVFFAFSTFVMKALSKLPPAQGIAAMQQINVYAVRSLFVASFLLTAVLCLAVILFDLFLVPKNGSGWHITGAVVYLTGCFLVTIVKNVPMNDVLAALSPADPTSEVYWRKYLSKWGIWNHVRTVSCLIAMACLIA